MDVSRIDPETALVDAENVDAGELSVDIDEHELAALAQGKEDKVLVSVRYVRVFPSRDISVSSNSFCRFQSQADFQSHRLVNQQQRTYP